MTSIKIQPADLPLIKTTFQKYFYDLPIDYGFFDDIIYQQYKKDKATMSLFNYFTLLAIIISCIGLYGLVSLILVQRIREISIRKVLVASLAQLLGLLTNEFVILVLIGLLIALPLAGMAINSWLHQFANHISLTWGMFLIPILVMLLITAMVISKEVLKTAFINPVKGLRSE